MIPCDFERICLQHAATECMQKSPNICQTKTNQNGHKTSQNGSRILSKRVSEKSVSEFADFVIFAMIFENVDVPQTL